MADFLDRVDKLPFPAERFDIVHVPDIVDVGDERDVGIGAAGKAQLIGNGFLELDKGIHIGTGSGEHIVGPEDDPHMQFAVPHGTLDELEAGAVIEFFINDRVPGDGNCPPCIR